MRLAELQREPIAVTGNSRALAVVTQLVVRAEVQVAEAYELETRRACFLNHHDRIDPAPVFNRTRFHMAAGVIDDTKDATGLQHAKHGCIDLGAWA